MRKAVRLDNNLYHFLKKHSELKLVLSPWRYVTNVIFPENCDSFTLVILDGKIEYLQYSTFDSSELFTYDAAKDSDYYKHIAQWFEETHS